MPGERLDAAAAYKSDIHREYLVTEEQTKFYQENGYIRMKQVAL